MSCDQSISTSWLLTFIDKEMVSETVYHRKLLNPHILDALRKQETLICFGSSTSSCILNYSLAVNLWLVCKSINQWSDCLSISQPEFHPLETKLKPPSSQNSLLLSYWSWSLLKVIFWYLDRIVNRWIDWNGSCRIRSESSAWLRGYSVCWECEERFYGS